MPRGGQDGASRRGLCPAGREVAWGGADPALGALHWWGSSAYLGRVPARAEQTVRLLSPHPSGGLSCQAGGLLPNISHCTAAEIKGRQADR